MQWPLWWCHAFSVNIKTRLGSEDFAGIQEEYSTYRSCLLEIALMQDDVTKFPLNAKARLGGDLNQVVTVVLLIFHFVEFPTDMFNIYYIPLEFLQNLDHQVSFWYYQKKRDIIMHKRDFVVDVFMYRYRCCCCCCCHCCCCCCCCHCCFESLKTKTWPMLFPDLGPRVEKKWISDLTSNTVNRTKRWCYNCVNSLTGRESYLSPFLSIRD